MPLQSWVKTRPSRIVFGCGSVTKSGAAEILALGLQRLVFIGSKRALSQDVSLKLRAELGSTVVGSISEISEHVPEELVEKAASQVREWGADGLVVIGGGSPIGLAKGVVSSVVGPDSPLTIISIPTTYSGSEVTASFGTLKKGPDGVLGKVAHRDERVRAKLVIYDSSLLRSLPTRTAIPSIFNAVAHSIEALWAPGCGPLSRMGALESLRLTVKYLPRLQRHPGDPEAVDQLLCAAYLAGVALDQEEMALQHKLAHLLGGTYHLPHAETHMTILPHVAHYNARALPVQAAEELLTDDVAGTLYDLQCQVVS